MKSREFLQLAGKLAASPTASPAAARSAVSRAYYAAYHFAKEFLEDLGIQVGFNHSEPPRFLSVSNHPDARQAGLWLFDLQSTRVKADSLSETDVESPEQARFHVERASKIISRLELCGSDESRATILAGITDYQSRLNRRST